MGRALASLSVSWVVCASGSRACLLVGMPGSCMQFQCFSPLLPVAPSEYRSLPWNQPVAWQRDTASWSSGAPVSCLPGGPGGQGDTSVFCCGLLWHLPWRRTQERDFVSPANPSAWAQAAVGGVFMRAEGGVIFGDLLAPHLSPFSPSPQGPLLQRAQVP